MTTPRSFNTWLLATLLAATVPAQPGGTTQEQVHVDLNSKSSPHLERGIALLRELEPRKALRELGLVPGDDPHLAEVFFRKAVAFELLECPTLAKQAFARASSLGYSIEGELDDLVASFPNPAAGPSAKVGYRCRSRTSIRLVPKGPNLTPQERFYEALIPSTPNDMDHEILAIAKGALTLRTTTGVPKGEKHETREWDAHRLHPLHLGEEDEARQIAIDLLGQFGAFAPDHVRLIDLVDRGLTSGIKGTGGASFRVIELWGFTVSSASAPVREPMIWVLTQWLNQDYPLLPARTELLVHFRNHEEDMSIEFTTDLIPLNGPLARQESFDGQRLARLNNAVHAGLAREAGPATINSRDEFGRTPLIRSSYWGDLEAVREQLGYEGVLVDAVNLIGVSALMEASAEGHLEVVRALLEAGASVNLQANEGSSALSGASWFGHAEVVDVLLEAGANPNLSFQGGLTPLLKAAEGAHIEIVRALIERGARVNAASNGGGTPLMAATLAGSTEVVKELLKHLEIEVNLATKADGFTAIMTASLLNRRAIVRLLLKHPNIDLGLTSKSGATALSLATDTTIIRLLKRAGR